MSKSGSSAKNKRNHRKTKRDSFDRFDDELCEKIVAHLTFEDKIRLQCVSKQWQWTVLRDQKVLTVDKDQESADNVLQLLLKTKKGKESKAKVDRNRFKNLVDQCPSIETIHFNVLIDDSVVAKMAHYCPQLDSIALDIKGISDEAIKKFGHEMGHQIKAIVFRNSCQSLLTKQRLLLSLCSNVQTLKWDDMALSTKKMESIASLKNLELMFDVIDHRFFAKISRFAPNLEQLVLKRRSECSTITLETTPPTMAALKTLVINGASVSPAIFANITKLGPDLEVLRLDGNFIVTNSALKRLSKLKSLTNLSLKTTSSANTVTDRGVSRLVYNSPQLKTIRLCFSPRITVKLIDNLVELAKQRPKSSLTFSCMTTDRKFRSSSRRCKPKNLKIKLIDNIG